jgi:chromosome segregation ATPase
MQDTFTEMSVIDTSIQNKQLQEQIVEMITRVEYLEQKNKNLSCSNTILKNNSETKKNRIDELNAQIIGLCKQTKALTAQVQERDSRIQALTAQVQERDSRIQALTAQVQERDSQIQTFIAQVHQQDSQINQLTLVNNANFAYIQHRDTEIRSLQTLLHNLQVQDNVQKTEIEQLQSDKQVQLGVIQKQAAEIEKLRNENQNLVTKKFSELTEDCPEAAEFTESLFRDV